MTTIIPSIFRLTPLPTQLTRNVVLQMIAEVDAIVGEIVAITLALDHNEKEQVRQYFGFPFNIYSVFGSLREGGGWDRRYRYLVNELNRAGIRYDPANLVFTES